MTLHTDAGLNSWPCGAVSVTLSQIFSKLWSNTPLPPSHSYLTQHHCVHSFPGSEVVIHYRHNHQKGPVEDALPAPAQEVQPASGAIDPFLHCNNPVCALHIHHCFVWISYRTGQQTETESEVCRKTSAVSRLPINSALHKSRIRKQETDSITAGSSHPGHNLFQLLPSGRRYRALYAKTSRYLW